MDQKDAFNENIQEINCSDKIHRNKFSTKAHHGVINIVKKYCPSSIKSYSEWIDCASLDKYYYFIKNLGHGDVEIYIEISPDKRLVYADSDKIIVKSCKVSYLQPLRESRFIRFSYKNINFAGVGLITSWFQAK